MNRAIHFAVATAAAGLLLAACSTASPPSPSPTTRPPTSSASPAPTTPAPTTPATGPTTPAPAPFAYQPLFPFANLAQAQAWEKSYSTGGHQPWHLSADLTALSFTQGYLGFREINRIAAHSVSGGDAHVTVGLTLPNGKVSRAAIIHLVKFGTGAHAPWEVVGTDDTTLTLDMPAYGSAATSPVKVGGLITGVDENLAVEVRTLGASGPVGSYCCRPAGGQRSPWSLTVTFHAAAGQVLTIVVHTGGHVAGVERFAVTGVRAG